MGASVLVKGQLSPHSVIVCISVSPLACEFHGAGAVSVLISVVCPAPATQRVLSWLNGSMSMSDNESDSTLGIQKRQS